MADRHPSFFGPVLPQPDDAPPAFSFVELQRIRARRIEVDVVKANASGWTAVPRFAALLPPPTPPRKRPASKESWRT